jgi:hypothetical protein
MYIYLLDPRKRVYRKMAMPGARMPLPHTPAGFVTAVMGAMVCVVLSGDIASGQVFRGYSSSGDLEFNSRKQRRRETVKGYYPGGQLEFIATYRKGKLDGDVREFYENGMLKAEIPYDDGKRDGGAKFYHENGMLMCKVYYDDDEETGKAKFYDCNGLLTTSVNMDKNRVRQLRRAQRRSEEQELQTGSDTK